MRYSRLFTLSLLVALCPGCGGCGHDKVVIKDDRREPATVVEPVPATTVIQTQPATAPAPATTVNVNR